MNEHVFILPPTFILNEFRYNVKQIIRNTTGGAMIWK